MEDTRKNEAGLPQVEEVLRINYEDIGDFGLILALNKGMTPDHIEQLVAHSNSDHVIAKYTPNDAKRFATFEDAAQRMKTRDTYALIEPDTQRLAGMIWFGEKEWSLEGEESPSHTYGIRLYHPFRGLRLASAFSEHAVEHFLANSATATGVWLETDQDNNAARRLYEKTGWEVLGQTDEDGARKMGRVVMSYTLD